MSNKIAHPKEDQDQVSLKDLLAHNSKINQNIRRHRLDRERDEVKAAYGLIEPGDAEKQAPAGKATKKEVAERDAAVAELEALRTEHERVLAQLAEQATKPPVVTEDDVAKQQAALDAANKPPVQEDDTPPWLKNDGGEEETK